VNPRVTLFSNYRWKCFLSMILVMFSMPHKAAGGPQDYTISMKTPKENGRHVIGRQLNVLVYDNQQLGNATKTLRLWRFGRVAPRLSGKPAYERTFTGHLETIAFKLPKNFPKGYYEIEVEWADEGKSNRLPVVVVDSPLEIGNWVPPEKVGGSISMYVNYVPPDCRIVVKRITAYPKDWWLPDELAEGSSYSFPPTNAPTSGGPDWIGATLPKSTGAGNFEVSVISKTEPIVSNTKYCSFNYPKGHGPRPIYILSYLGISSLLDTDEMGSDELYPIFAVSYDQNVKVDGQTHYLERGMHKVGLLHEDMDKGETRNRSDEIGRIEDPIEYLGFAVALLEHDNTKFSGFQTSIKLVWPIKDSQKLAEKLKEQIRKYLEHDPPNNSDELLGVRPVEFTKTDLENARKKKSGLKKDLIFLGDGGMFTLRFLLQAGPRAEP